MRLDFTREPITDDDARIRAAVATVSVPPLLAAVAHLTGDLSLLRDDLRPDLSLVMTPNDGYSDAQLAEARRIAADALIAFRDGGQQPAPPPDDATLTLLVSFVNGGSVDDPDYLRLLEEELALGGADLRAPQWQARALAPDRTVHVAVIGAGMSGIAVAHRLRQAGVDVSIYEKNDDVGGTWLENDYPGCRVDIQSHFYSYSFAQSPDWPHYNSTQPVLLDYFRSCVERLGLHDVLHLSSEVTEIVWDDAEQHWRLRLRDRAGNERTATADAVVSAVGQLNRPLLPDLAGIDSFAGPWFHSARWDHTVDLTGKRVGIIGTGASALQFIPPVADQAAHVTVHQRTPPWLLPVPTYMDELPDGMRWLLRHVPELARWDRLWMFARTQEGLLPLAVADPAWDTSKGSVSEANHLMRTVLEGYYELAFPDPELRAAVLPSYPPTAKRMVLDNGIWPKTLQRDDVTLETGAIAEIVPEGVRMADGRTLRYDVIIYGTGFQASRFLTPMRVVGEGGADLHERWGGDARAYLGITIPGFPNLFLMYGPNTNIVINGSIIYFSECETTYIVESMRMLLEQGARSMSCRPEVHDAYNERVDAGNRARAWGVSDVHSWYKNEFGRVAQNWPFNLYEYWRQTRHPDPADYVLR